MFLDPAKLLENFMELIHLYSLFTNIYCKVDIYRIKKVRLVLNKLFEVTTAENKSLLTI